MNYQAQLYMIAQEAHKGASDRDVREMCAELAAECNISSDQVYRDSEAVFYREFN